TAHAAPSFAWLGKEYPAERRAVGEPDREPVPRLGNAVHLRPAYGAGADHLDERDDVERRRDRRRLGRGHQRRLAALDVDRAHLAADVVEIGAHLRTWIAPGLIEKD